jgi:hypothetical protein
MKLVNMKIDTAEREKRYAEPSVAADRPMYPWGLSVNLDTEALEKLGLADDLPEVGATMKLEARVDVVSVSENDTSGGGKTCSVSLQITDLGLSTPKEPAEKLYESKS